MSNRGDAALSVALACLVGLVTLGLLALLLTGAETPDPAPMWVVPFGMLS